MLSTVRGTLSTPNTQQLFLIFYYEFVKYLSQNLEAKESVIDILNLIWYLMDIIL